MVLFTSLQMLEVMVDFFTGKILLVSCNLIMLIFLSNFLSDSNLEGKLGRQRIGFIEFVFLINTKTEIQLLYGLTLLSIYNFVLPHPAAPRSW